MKISVRKLLNLNKQQERKRNAKSHRLEKGFIYLGRGYRIDTDEDERLIDYIKVNDSDLSTHMHVLGATGSGKTVFLTYLDTQFLYNGYSLIKLDMKYDEQNFKLVYALAYHLNKPFYFLNLASASGSNAGLAGLGTHSYNPLETGDELSITAKIMQATKGQGAVAYYEEVKETTVKAFVSAFLSTGKKWTFRDWYATMIDYEILLELIKQTKNQQAKSYLYNLYERLNDDKKRMQAEKDISGLRNFTAKMSDYDFLNSYVSDINFEKLIFADAVIYVVLPKLLFGEVAKSLGKMIASDLQYITGYLSANMQKTKVVLSIDEFENFVFEGIQDLLSKGRSAGVRIIAAHQSLSDISHEEKETMKRIIQANTRIKVFLSQADTESGEWFSQLVGKKGIRVGMGIDDMINVSDNHQYIVEPHQLTSLQNFQAYFYIRGKAYKGHIYSVPTDFELGKDVPKPVFEASIDRVNGIRLWEMLTEKQNREINADE